MKRILFVFAVGLLLSALFVSCQKTKERKYTEYSRAYFPLQFGRYVVYNVDSTLWDDFNCVKSLHKYQIRYTIADTFRDNEDRISYRVDVHIRNNDSLPWKVHRVYYATPTDTHLEWVEENVRFIKLVFPMENGITWKGNSMIPALDQDLQYFYNWDYTYSGFTEAFNDGLVFYDNTITVSHVDEQQNDPESMPSAYSYKTFSKEVYGYDIGMVYREMTHWVYDPGVASCRKGFTVVMRAVEHN